VQQALDRGLLINVTADTVVRLLPPLNLTWEQADTLVAMLSELILEFLARGVAAQPAAA
jgi:acetylornithine aminotransferase